MDRERGPVLFGVSSANQAKIFLLIADELSKRGHEVRFLSFDRFYNQGAARILVGTNYHCSQVPMPPIIEEWCALSPTETAPIIEKAGIFFDSFIHQIAPSVVVVANDLGPIEQSFLRCAEARGAGTCRIQDGVIHYEPIAPGTRSSPAQMGDGGADLHCLWTTRHISEMRSRGIQGKIVETGNPRFDSIHGWKYVPRSNPPYRLLVATQPFARYGQMAAAAEVSIYERLVRRLLRRPDVEIVLKLHPQTDLDEPYQAFAQEFPGRITIVKSADSIETLKTCDAAVTISSSLALESAVLGIPTAIAFHYRSFAHDFKLSEKLFDHIYLSTSFPRDFKFGQMIEEIVEQSCRAPDGMATARCADCIIELIDSTKQAPAKAPASVSTSILLQFDHLGNPVPAIRSLLRSADHEVEIVAVDRSLNGSAGEDLSLLLSDPRLRILRAPGASVAEGLSRGLIECRGIYVVTAHSAIVALPHAVRSLVDALKNHPDAALSCGGFFLRNAQGTCQNFCVLPGEFSADFLLKDIYAPSAIDLFAFRKDRAQGIRFNASSDLPELDFASKLFHAFGATSRGVSLSHPIFLTPVQYSTPLSKMAAEVRAAARSEIARIEIQSSSPPILALIQPETPEGARRVLSQLNSQNLRFSPLRVILIHTGSEIVEGVQRAETENLNITHLHENEFLSAQGISTLISESSPHTLGIIFDDSCDLSKTVLEEHRAVHQTNGTAFIGLGKTLMRPEHARRLFSQTLLTETFVPGFSPPEDVNRFSTSYALSNNISFPLAKLANQPFIGGKVPRLCRQLSLGLHLFQQGCRIRYIDPARVIRIAPIKIRDFLAIQAAQAQAIVALCKSGSSPQIFEALLGQSKIDETLLNRWNESSILVENTFRKVAQTLEELDTQLLPSHDGDAYKKARELIFEMVEATRLLATYQHNRIYYESFSGLGILGATARL